MAVKIEVVGEKVIATDAASVESLNKGSFGLPVEGKKDKLWLLPEEALYLADVRGAEITRNSTRIDFNQLAFPYRGEIAVNVGCQPRLF